MLSPSMTSRGGLSLHAQALSSFTRDVSLQDRRASVGSHRWTAVPSCVDRQCRHHPLELSPGSSKASARTERNMHGSGTSNEVLGGCEIAVRDYMAQRQFR